MSDALELSVTRFIAAAPDVVWHAMTARIEAWWCPRPWHAKIVALDWRAGGRACFEMRGPDGEVMPNDGTVLEFTPGKRFVLTDAFVSDWQPAGPFMVGIFSVEPEGDGTRYTACARHWDTTALERHKAMGFDAGWTAASAQLAALVEN